MTGTTRTGNILPSTTMLSSSGGMPGELHGGWRTAATPGAGPTSGVTMDLA